MGYAANLFYHTHVKKSIHTAHQKEVQALLRSMRMRAGLRQSELAERLGCPQSFVSKYENGERRLDILELRQVCEAMGTSLLRFVQELEQRLT